MKELPKHEPLVTVLNFSAGVQSSALLWMVIKGDIPRPDPFLVLNADPGMENSGTYQYIREVIGPAAEEAGIKIHTVEGPDLYEDLINLKSTDATRFDNPPYWTLKQSGSVGRLRQKCTQIYKIAPMDRFIRKYLEDNFKISRKSKRLGKGIVRKWIGFSADEKHRVKPSKQKYVQFDYPLIHKGMTKQDVRFYFKRHGLPIPPRSVCNACFANGLDTLKEMHDNRPEDWAQAVAVDESVRDLSQIMIEDEVYVSRACLPLTELAKRDFKVGDEEKQEEWSCDTGYCFL